MDSLNLPCAPSGGGGSHQGALSLGASSVSDKGTGLGHLQTHLHSVCTTRDTPMPSLSWGLLRGSSLATLIFSNFSLNPGKQGAISTPLGFPLQQSLWVRWSTPADIRMWCWALSLSVPPLGAMSLAFVTLASSMKDFMIIPPVWSAPRLFLRQRAQIPRMHLCDEDRMMAGSASVSSCYRLAILTQILELP